MNGHATCPEKKRHKKGTALRIIDRLTSKNKAKVSMHGYFLSQRKVNKTAIKYSADQKLFTSFEKRQATLLGISTKSTEIVDIITWSDYAKHLY